jgi:hypothetical protein
MGGGTLTMLKKKMVEQTRYYVKRSEQRKNRGEQ